MAEPSPGTPSWFGSLSPPTAAPVALERPSLSRIDPTGFDRLWKAFMSARVVLALALLGLQVAAHRLAQPLPLWLLGLGLGYAVLTLLARLLARPQGPGRSFDSQWLFTAGVDLVYFGVLHSQQAPGIQYTPLLALPVLMTGILGSRALALGTAALAALALLGDALVGGRGTPWASTTELAQAGLLGAGLMALSWLTNTLSVRLAREQEQGRRTRAEAQIQSLVNNLVIETLDDGVLVVDASYTVRAANPAAHRMLGSDQEVTPDVFNLADNPVWIQLMDVVRLTFLHEAVDTVDVILHHEDRHAGRLRVRTERTPSMGEQGAALCVMFLQDQREMEARLRTEKLASMGRMSAAVAHELRNPLAAISQANALLEEELALPGQQRLTAMIRQNAERLAHIVDDVLDVARAQSQSDFSEVVALNDEIEVFVQEWATQHQVGERLHLELLAPDVPVQFDRDHLRRLLVNLLDNAARYASRRPGAIRVETQSIRHGPVLLAVWSDGVPMEPSVERHLFEPFFSSESRSSGLGLYICRELCERHGAGIAYERTARGQNGRMVDGNEFFVRLRRAPGGHSSWNLEE